MYPRAERYFALALLAAFIGFFPSYFSRLGEASSAHHWHGLTAAAWLLCLVLQAWLIRTRRIVLHRLLGRCTLLLVPVFIVSGLRVVHLMVSSPGGFSQTFGPRLAFLDFTTLGYFLAAYLLALWHRREVQLHARFMASTAVLVLPPALARALLFFVPGFGSFPLAVHGGYVLSELVTLLLLRDDQRRGGVRRPYVMLMALLLVQHAGFVLMPYVPAWRVFTTWFGAL